MGLGFGFYENNWSGVRTFEHGGDMLGFSSYLALVPEHNMGIFIVNHHENTNLRYRALGLVMEHYFGDSNKRIKAPSPKKDAISRAKLFTGSYRWLSSCKTCPNERGMRWNITANDDGTLNMIGRKWIEVTPYFFMSEDGNSKLGFRTDSIGNIIYMFLGNVDAFEKVNP